MFDNHEARKLRMREQGRCDIIDAHTHTVDHQAELAASKQAGCFFGDASGFPVTDKQFLKDMNEFWFS